MLCDSLAAKKFRLKMMLQSGHATAKRTAPRRLKRTSLTDRLKVLKKRRKNLHPEELQLKRLKRVVDSKENHNPLSLLKVLLDEQPVDYREKNPNKKSNWEVVIFKALKFLGQVILVMSLLYTAAIIFAYLEDQGQHNDQYISIFNKNESNTTAAYLWTSLEDHFDLKLEGADRKLIYEILSKKIDVIKTERKHTAQKHGSGYSHLKVQKWLYFVIIASTTIGYGDVTPKSQNGKIFYCCFSIVGIILMMSLLKSCGAVITSVNKRFYGFAQHYVFADDKVWSEESISLIATLCMFAIFLVVGIWHDSMDDNYHYGLTDTIYFWITSFTTVGFGDIGHSLEFEIEHAYELTVYRVFGLSLLAAIINCILSYADLQRRTIQRETEAYQRKILEKVRFAVERSKSFNSRQPRQNPCSVMKGLKAVVITAIPLTPSSHCKLRDRETIL